MKSKCLYRTVVLTSALVFGVGALWAEDKKSTTDPADFVEVYEHSGKTQILRYDGTDAKNNVRIFKVDSASSLVLKIRTDKLKPDSVLNQLRITAQLASDGKNTAVPVAGYSVIGEDSAKGAAQTAVAFQTTAEIAARMENLYWTARDILDQDLPGCRAALEMGPKDAALPGSSPACKFPDDKVLVAQASKTLTTFKDEITSLSKFFADPHNIAVVRLLSNEIFGMDADTVLTIATNFPIAVDTLTNDKSTDAAKATTANALVTRVWLIYRDMILDYNLRKANKTAYSLEQYRKDVTKDLIEKLQNSVVPGQIDLAPAGAKDGDTLTITIESRAAEGNGGTSATLNLNVLIKNYGYRAAVSPSLLFLRRIGVTEADKSTRNLNPVRFAPSPGVTYGVTFLPRHPIWSALAPGMGANLSFMNYDDPKDFNISTGKFTNSTAVNVQFGAGIQFTMFNNMLQATYGWNLNAPEKRAYWGLGFGFFDVAKYFAAKFGK